MKYFLYTTLALFLILQSASLAKDYDNGEIDSMKKEMEQLENRLKIAANELNKLENIANNPILEADSLSNKVFIVNQRVESLVDSIYYRNYKNSENIMKFAQWFVTTILAILAISTSVYNYLSWKSMRIDKKLFEDEIRDFHKDIEVKRDRIENKIHSLEGISNDYFMEYEKTIERKFNEYSTMINEYEHNQNQVFYRMAVTHRLSNFVSKEKLFDDYLLNIVDKHIFVISLTYLELITPKYLPVQVNRFKALCCFLTQQHDKCISYLYIALTSANSSGKQIEAKMLEDDIKWVNANNNI